MDVKGKYPDAGGNPISTALERVGSLFSPYVKIPECCHFVVLACTYNRYGNTAASSSRVA